jgi:hypothetical protein
LVFRFLLIISTPARIISASPKDVKIRVPGPPVAGSSTPGVLPNEDMYQKVHYLGPRSHLAIH